MSIIILIDSHANPQVHSDNVEIFGGEKIPGCVVSNKVARWFKQWGG